MLHSKKRKRNTIYLELAHDRYYLVFQVVVDRTIPQINLVPHENHRNLFNAELECKKKKHE